MSKFTHFKPQTPKFAVTSTLVPQRNMGVLRYISDKWLLGSLASEPHSEKVWKDLNERIGVNDKFSQEVSRILRITLNKLKDGTTQGLISELVKIGGKLGPIPELDSLRVEILKGTYANSHIDTLVAKFKEEGKINSRIEGKMPIEHSLAADNLYAAHQLLKNGAMLTSAQMIVYPNLILGKAAEGYIKFVKRTVINPYIAEACKNGSDIFGAQDITNIKDEITKKDMWNRYCAHVPDSIEPLVDSEQRLNREFMASFCGGHSYNPENRGYTENIADGDSFVKREEAKRFLAQEPNVKGTHVR